MTASLHSGTQYKQYPKLTACNTNTYMEGKSYYKNGIDTLEDPYSWYIAFDVRYVG